MFVWAATYTTAVAIEPTCGYLVVVPLQLRLVTKHVEMTGIPFVVLQIGFKCS